MTVLKGMFVGLRSVTENDAEFILKIRTDEKLAKFLNKTSPDIEMQKTWIRGQIARDGDYYFIIEDLKSGNPLGCISIYDIVEKSGEFGRWISIGNSLQNIESCILLYDFAFEKGLDFVDSFTDMKNSNIVNFHKSFGAVFVKELASGEYKNNSSNFAQYRMTKEHYQEVRESKITLLKNFL